MQDERRPVLLHAFSTFAVGGPEVRFTRLANAFGREFRHVIVAMDGVLDSRNLIDTGVDVVCIGVPVKKSKGLSISNLLTFRRALTRIKPSLLVTYNWGAIEWGAANWLFPACPHIHFEDGFDSEETGTRQIARRVWFRRMVLSHRTRIVVPSWFLYRIATGVWHLSATRVLHIPNGIDVVRYNRPPDLCLSQMLRKKDGEIIIGSVGILRPEKNFKRLIRIFAQIQDNLTARLAIVGQGPERSSLEDLARSLAVSDRVTFFGHISSPERILGAFDVFAITSDTEQMPFTLLEAMAARLPIVATDVGDIRKVVAPENHPEIVNVHAEGHFLKCLTALIEDPQRRANLGTANYNRVRSHFSADKMVDAYHRLFCEMIAAK
jgi:glycosyltransferase involved in cell wall biosynthesis